MAFLAVAAAGVLSVEGAFRPPAVPLVSIDPFFSVWSRADKLTDTYTSHWTGQAQPMEAVLTVDGKAYRLMGQPENVPDALPQTGCTVMPLQTICTFANDKVYATLIFSTPLMPENLDVFSRPVTYVTLNVQSADGEDHQISLGYTAGGELVTNDDNAEVAAQKIILPNGMPAVRFGRVKQTPLCESGDRIRCNWGYAWVVAGGKNSVTELSATTAAAGKIRCSVITDLGKTRKTSTHLLLAYDDVKSLVFFDRVLQAWWRRSGKSFEKMLEEAESDYAGLMSKMSAFDREFQADMQRCGGEKYADIAMLSYRQSFAACKLVADPNGQPLYFSKENASNGCMGTVDLLYPQMPHLLLMSPTLARATIAPIMLYSSDSRWKHPYSPHDIGQYPLGNAQRYGGGESSDRNQMPVEESGNMLISLAALSQLDGNADFASQWWPTITRWAEYLADKGFDPENQLCTDDFAGHLAHNANLSVKAIMGLASYAKMAKLRGDQETADKYFELAKSLVPKWIEAAKGGANGSYRLAFDREGTWSMKYNMVWDAILGFNLFPESVKQQEMASYRKLLQPYGLPLDNRKNYTKVDWTVWTATLTRNREDFDAVIAALHRFANETPDRIPFTDWYFADSGKFRGFIARSVVGGVFIPALYDQQLWYKYARRDKANTQLYAPLRPKNLNLKTLVPTGRENENEQWKYTFSAPPAGWEKPDFDDSAWRSGPAGFGANNPPQATIRTKWSTPDLWVRRTVTLDEIDPGTTMKMFMHHDEDATVFFNGVQAGTYAGYTIDYVPFDIAPAAVKALNVGKNVVAAKIHQSMGGQYFDFGLGTSVSDKTFKLASFNLRCPADKGENSFEQRLPRIIKVVERRGFDCMGVQEATPMMLKAICAALPGWDCVGRGRNKDGNGEANSVFFKKDRFELLASDTFQLSETPDIPGSVDWKTACPRICTWAHLRDKITGRSFFFFNTHLDHISGEARQRGMATILNRMKLIAQGQTVFLTGDMNSVAGTGSDIGRELVKLAGPDLSKKHGIDPIGLAKVVLLDSKDISATPHAGPVNTFTAYADEGKALIDYVFTTGNVNVHSHCTCDDRFDGKLHPSDHDPVMVEVSLD